jgi:hypothetical protein
MATMVPAATLWWSRARGVPTFYRRLVLAKAVRARQSTGTSRYGLGVRQRQEWLGGKGRRSLANGERSPAVQRVRAPRGTDPRPACVTTPVHSAHGACDGPAVRELPRRPGLVGPTADARGMARPVLEGAESLRRIPISPV